MLTAKEVSNGQKVYFKEDNDWTPAIVEKKPHEATIIRLNGGEVYKVKDVQDRLVASLWDITSDENLCFKKDVVKFSGVTVDGTYEDYVELSKLLDDLEDAAAPGKHIIEVFDTSTNNSLIYTLINGKLNSVVSEDEDEDEALFFDDDEDECEYCECSDCDCDCDCDFCDEECEDEDEEEDENDKLKNSLTLQLKHLESKIKVLDAYKAFEKEVDKILNSLKNG